MGDGGPSRRGLAVATVAISLYAVVVALFRLPEVLDLLLVKEQVVGRIGDQLLLQVEEARTLPGYPNWLLTYLTVLVGSVASLGLAGVVYGGFGFRKVPPRTGYGVALAVAIVGLLAFHGYFVFGRDLATAEGGLIWGFVHVLTLTRLHIPGGATDAGLAGYRFGQVLGLLSMTLWPLVLTAFAVTSGTEASSLSDGGRKQEDEPEAVRGADCGA